MISPGNEIIYLELIVFEGFFLFMAIIYLSYDWHGMIHQFFWDYSLWKTQENGETV